jgi:hypothetical protein
MDAFIIFACSLSLLSISVIADFTIMNLQRIQRYIGGIYGN